MGCIFTFHRVVSGKVSQFNNILEITDSKFEEIIVYLLKNKYNFISIDQAHEILVSGKSINQKFIVITFDDGYEDNYSIAYPILKKYNIPFTIYIATDFPNQKLIIWWYLLEDIILANNEILFEYKNQPYVYNCETQIKKNIAFTEIRKFIIDTENGSQTSKLESIFKNYTLNMYEYTKKLAISWEQIKELSMDSLCTIGVHTVSHQALSKISENEVYTEIEKSQQIIENCINKKTEHFAYPFGSKNEFGKREIEIVKKLAFKTATTTLVGNIFPEHINHIHSLPRIFISENINRFALNIRLNGIYQYTTNNLKKMDLCT